ncbi:hypothetical protein [Phenylobacterium sp.]|uniref:hypothetical protein n=1 Tax=Phenylobacterium sp. TaxID=1871053 RepID=UPI002F3E69CD
MVLLGISPEAAAASNALRIESRVYEAEGEPSGLARRAVVCIGQIVKPGLITAPTIVATDIAGGTVVANSSFHFDDLHFFSTPYTVRSTMTFEAKSGRFRIVHTDTAVLDESALDLGWAPAYQNVKLYGAIEGRLQSLSGQVAACVKAVPADW